MFVLRIALSLLAAVRAAHVAIDDAHVMSFLKMEDNKLGKSADLSGASHPWPHFRGPLPGQYGIADAVAPENLTAALAWSWHHPGGQYHTVLAGGPVIDSNSNVYLTAADGIRKFSPQGDVLWHYTPPGTSNNAPMIMGDKVYGSAKSGHAFAIHMETGEAAWETQLAEKAGGDSGYPAAFDGVFVVGAQEGHVAPVEGGNERVFGVNASSGEKLWNFEVAKPVWNFAPLFPGDGTVVFMDFSGGMYRLGLHNGTLLWHTPAPGCKDCFGDGGASLGPNQAVYTCSNAGASNGSEGTKGALRAFALSDGMMMWEHILPQPCNSYPAVGHVQGSSGLSVVVTPGSFMGKFNLHGSVMAFDADSGALLWQYQTKPWQGFMAKGDIEGWAERTREGVQSICLPAHWSASTISSDGTVYAARCDGLLYAVRGPAGGAVQGQDLASLPVDFPTTPGVTATAFDAGGASLHGAAAWAPGMLALGTCDTLFVFAFGGTQTTATAAAHQDHVGTQTTATAAAHQDHVATQTTATAGAHQDVGISLNVEVKY